MKLIGFQLYEETNCGYVGYEQGVFLSWDREREDAILFPPEQLSRVWAVAEELKDRARFFKEPQILSFRIIDIYANQ